MRPTLRLAGRARLQLGFDANCRALAILIGVREAMKARSAPDGESVDDLFERLTQEYWQVRGLRHDETVVALYKKLP